MTVRIRKVRSTIASMALVGMLSAVFAPFASAADTRISLKKGDVPEALVRYGDLDLATDAGAHELYRRILIGSQLVCGNPDHRDLVAMRVSRNCRMEAIQRAVQAVGNPQLAAISAAHSPPS